MRLGARAIEEVKHSFIYEAEAEVYDLTTYRARESVAEQLEDVVGDRIRKAVWDIINFQLLWC